MILLSAAFEPSTLTTELLTLAVAAVEWRHDKVTWPEQGRLEEWNCCFNYFRKASVGQKACENQNLRAKLAEK